MDKYVLLFLYVCLYPCLCVCVYNCLGSQRVTEPEFDEGTTVVSKGGWGQFPHYRVPLSDLVSYVWSTCKNK